MSMIIVKAQSENLPMTSPAPENKQHSQHHANKQHSQHHVESLSKKWPTTSPVQQNRWRSQHHMYPPKLMYMQSPVLALILSRITYWLLIQQQQLQKEDELESDGGKDEVINCPQKKVKVKYTNPPLCCTGTVVSSAIVVAIQHW